jgi:hypothetical protein
MLTECIQPTQNCKTSTSIALFHRKQWNYLILVRKFCIRQLYSRLKKKYSNSYQKYIEPEAEGTLISNQQMDFTNPVKGISHIDKISLITLEGPGMIGGWFFQKTFLCVSQENVNVVLLPSLLRTFYLYRNSKFRCRHFKLL